MRWIIATIWVFLLGVRVSAQTIPATTSNLRVIFVDQPTDSLFLDTLPVVPSSLQITTGQDQPLPPSYTYQLIGNRLVWTHAPPDQTLRIQYRVLPFSRSSPIQVFDSTVWSAEASSTDQPQRFRTRSRSSSLLDVPALDYSGSFGRGLSVGNRQNLVLNSNFNLQMAGDLGNDIQLLAAITDESIPLQPAGNTRQLREFDRVFVQLSRRDQQLTAGDYELAPTDSYFLRFFKKLQGATFTTNHQLGSGTLESASSIAVARGQFVRQQLNLSEGNQGPYRLQGNRGERFIIVLAGTERVYLDGQLLIRGIEDDYTIDYNLGEITFTAQTLITRESRVFVEFEYADQNYLRSLTYLDNRYQSENLEVYMQLYSQQDSRNSTLNLQLTEADRQALQTAGDQPEKAVRPAINPVAEARPSRVTYQRRDTITPCGQVDSILVFTKNASAQLYSASFTYVGPGNGNYLLAAAGLANEPVYRWVAPDPTTCQPRGEYAPVARIPTPEQQQILTAGARIRLGPRARLQTEMALSRFDRNRFSTIDDADDAGGALFTRYQQAFPLENDPQGWTLTADLSHEFKRASFSFLNPYRPQEFLRDWGLADFQGRGQVEAADEHLIHASIGLTDAQAGEIAYTLSSFLRASGYQGMRHGVEGSMRFGANRIYINSSTLTARTTDDERRFLRPDLAWERTFTPGNGGIWRAEVGYQGEQNVRRSIRLDSLLPASYGFGEWRAVLSRPDSSSWPLRLEYRNRRDQLPGNNQLQETLQAQRWTLASRYRFGKVLQLKTRLNYRELSVRRPEATEQRGQRTFLGRLQAGVSLLQGVLRSSTLYELGTGQEPRIDFTYVEVAPGEGQYVWLDSLYNNDGVIQPNEMEIAPFPDQANYVRVSRITNDFIGTHNVRFNQSLTLIPRVAWFSEKNNLKSALARFSSQTSLRINRKVEAANSRLNLNPFDLNVVDTNLVSLSSGIQQTLFFNRGKPTFEAQAGWTDQRSRIAQVTGFESRRRSEYFLRTRYNLETTWTLRLNAATGNRFSESENFSNKNFLLQFWEVSPELEWTPSRFFRCQTSLRWQNDQDQSRENGDAADTREWQATLTYNQSVKTTLTGSLSLVQVDYEGQPNSPTGFAILNGLQAGRNLLWNVQLDQQLGQNLRLSLSYEGRDTGQSQVVHVGRAQVSAVF